MKEPITIAIAEDHNLLRQGLVSVLGSEPSFEVMFDAENGEVLLQKLEEYPIDVLLLDLDMPKLGGLEVLRIMYNRFPNVRPIIITMHYSKYFVLECFALGARGFLPKHTNVEKIFEAMSSVKNHGFYINDDSSMNFLVDEIKRRQRQGLIHITFPNLIDDNEIIDLLCNGALVEDVAERCHVTPRDISLFWEDFLISLRHSYL